MSAFRQQFWRYPGGLKLVQLKYWYYAVALQVPAQKATHRCAHPSSDRPSLRWRSMACEAREKEWLETGPSLDWQLQPQAEHFAVRCPHDAEIPVDRGADIGARAIAARHAAHRPTRPAAQVVQTPLLHPVG